MSEDEGAGLHVHEAEIHEIYRLEPAEVPVGSTPGRWPCAACGGGYPVQAGWLVDYYHEPTREIARAYICARCAAQAQAQGPAPGR